MKSYPLLRRIAAAIAEHASRVLPQNRREWARAMSSEVESIDNDVEAMFWSLGCAFASYRERVHIMAKFNLNVARWVLGLEALVCLGPLALLWTVMVYTLGTTEISTTSVVVPTAIATVGPIGLLLAMCAVIMRRAVPAELFALLAFGFCALAFLQIARVGTLWFAFDWRVWLLDSILPGLACAHLALTDIHQPVGRLPVNTAN